MLFTTGFLIHPLKHFQLPSSASDAVSHYRACSIAFGFLALSIDLLQMLKKKKGELILYI